MDNDSPDDDQDLMAFDMRSPNRSAAGSAYMTIEEAKNTMSEQSQNTHRTETSSSFDGEDDD